MPIYNPETQEYEETPEEKQLREQQAAAAQQQPQIQVGPAPAPAGPAASRPRGWPSTSNQS